MKRLRPLLIGLLLPIPAASEPCSTHTQAGEHVVLRLMSVRVDGIPVTDLTGYAEYEVTLRADVAQHRQDARTHYVHFNAYRQEFADAGREQSETLDEFYPVP